MPASTRLLKNCLSAPMWLSAFPVFAQFITSYCSLSLYVLPPCAHHHLTRFVLTCEFLLLLYCSVPHRRRASLLFMAESSGPEAGCASGGSNVCLRMDLLLLGMLRGHIHMNLGLNQVRL